MGLRDMQTGGLVAAHFCSRLAVTWPAALQRTHSGAPGRGRLPLAVVVSPYDVKWKAGTADWMRAAAAQRRSPVQWGHGFCNQLGMLRP